MIIGDIVGSTKIPEDTYDQVLDAIYACQAWLRGHYGAGTDFFRGDSYQIYLPDPADALWVAAYTRLSLRTVESDGKPVDARVCMALAPVEGLRTPFNLTTGTGVRRAWEGVNSMGSDRLRIRYAEAEQSSELRDALAAADMKLRSYDSDAARSAVIAIESGERPFAVLPWLWETSEIIRDELKTLA